jgi:hypothetical protein
MPQKPLDLPMQVVKGFAKDLKAFHAERSEVKRAEIAQRQLDALAPFNAPRAAKLRLRDVIAMFEEMRDQM